MGCISDTPTLFHCCRGTWLEGMCGWYIRHPHSVPLLQYQTPPLCSIAAGALGWRVCVGGISDTPTLFHCCRGTWLEGMCGWYIRHPHSVPLLQGHLVGGYVWVVYQTPTLCSIAAGALGWRVCVGGISDTPTLFHCCRGTWLEGMCGWYIRHPHSVPLLQGHLVGGYVWVVYQTPPLCSIAAGALGWRVCMGGISDTPTLFHCCRGTWLEGMCGWYIRHPLCSIAAGALGWRVCVGGIPEGSASHLVDHPSLCSRAQANR